MLAAGTILLMLSGRRELQNDRLLLIGAGRRQKLEKVVCVLGKGGTWRHALIMVWRSLLQAHMLDPPRFRAKARCLHCFVQGINFATRNDQLIFQ
jgi:hypothetical protein